MPTLQCCILLLLALLGLAEIHFSWTIACSLTVALGGGLSCLFDAPRSMERCANDLIMSVKCAAAAIGIQGGVGLTILLGGVCLLGGISMQLAGLATASVILGGLSGWCWNSRKSLIDFCGHFLGRGAFRTETIYSGPSLRPPGSIETNSGNYQTPEDPHGARIILRDWNLED